MKIEVKTITSGNKDHVFAIRRKVFVDEQQVPPEEEIDEYEEEATHFLACVGGEPAGAARMRWKDEKTAKAERVAVLSHFRGTGVGRELMQAIEKEAQANNARSIQLSAQTHAQPFYKRLGYEAYGDVFLDAGIEHIAMKKQLNIHL